MKSFVIGILALVLMAWFVWPRPQTPAGAAIAALPLASHPEKPWQKNGHKIIPLKKFQINALVLRAERYWMDRESQLSPLDLALGWGPMSDPAVLKRLSIMQSGRWYYVSWGRNPPLSERQIFSNSSNCHIIPATDKLAHTLKGLSKGDLVDLSGYIVRVEGPDGWQWSNSTSWDNGGGSHACKILWVESCVSK